MAVVALAVGIYAIKDVRKLVRRYVIEEQRNAVYAEAVHWLCWDFIDPLPLRDMYTPEIAILMQRFAMLQKALDPNRTDQASKEAIEYGALETASGIVDTQKAEWKQDLDMEKVKAMLNGWRDEKAKARVANVFKGKNRTLL